MEIDSNSWHARVYKKYGKSDQPNLCQYFWRVILGAPLVWAFDPDRGNGFIRPLISMLLLMMLVTMLFGIIIGEPWWHGPLAILFLFIGVGMFVSIVAMFGNLIDKWAHRDRPPNQSLTRSYISAKKNKVCPYIEFTEE